MTADAKMFDEAHDWNLMNLSVGSVIMKHDAVACTSLNFCSSFRRRRCEYTDAQEA